MKNETINELPHRMNPMARKPNHLWQRLRIVAVLVSVAAFALTIIPAFLYVSLVSSKEYRQRLPFESVAWKQRAYDSDANFMWPTRKRMVDDLLKSRQLEKKSRAVVIELLGKPDKTLPTPEEGITYILGPERGYGVDYEWLQVHFDSDGTVREVTTTTD